MRELIEERLVCRHSADESWHSSAHHTSLTAYNKHSSTGSSLKRPFLSKRFGPWEQIVPQLVRRRPDNHKDDDERLGDSHMNDDEALRIGGERTGMHLWIFADSFPNLS